MICYKCDVCGKVVECKKSRMNRAFFWIPRKIPGEAVSHPDRLEVSQARTEPRMEEIEMCDGCMMKMLQAVDYGDEAKG